MGAGTFRGTRRAARATGPDPSPGPSGPPGPPPDPPGPPPVPAVSPVAPAPAPARPTPAGDRRAARLLALPSAGRPLLDAIQTKLLPGPAGLLNAPAPTATVGPVGDASGGEKPQWPADFSPGAPREVAPGVRRVVAPNPGIMTGPGTNSYLIGADRVAVVDPGPDDDSHLAALLAAGGDRIAWIVVTHSHIDHSPLAVRLREATGAPVVGFGPAPVQPATGGLDPHDGTFAPDRRLGDGDRIDLGDCALDALYTPGHASNHLCFELAGSGLLFSGDHVMSGSTVVIAPPDGDMAVYLESLEKVRDRSPRRIAPGHGAMIDDPAAVLDGYLRHRQEREAQVLRALSAVGADAGEGWPIESLVAAIYVDVPEALHPVARYSVWAHLRKLAAEGRATSPQPDDLSAPWRAVTGG